MPLEPAISGHVFRRDGARGDVWLLAGVLVVLSVRIGWVAVLHGAAGFAAGLLYARLRRPD